MAFIINWAKEAVLAKLANKTLNIVARVYTRASQDTILSFISSIAKTTLGALVGNISPVNSVIKFIMSNQINRETFVFVREHWSEVVYFLIDLMEPMKRFSTASSSTGQPDPDEAGYNDFNELDMTVPMNAHAVISQVQRMLMSLTCLFTQKSVNISRFTMDTRLATDTSTGHEETDVQTLRVSSRNGEKPETWLFINGIAGEYHWTTLAVNKLARRFFTPSKRDGTKPDSSIVGVFNRSDGILWDLIECGSERTPDTSIPSINESTASSRAAQSLLEAQLRSALLSVSEETPTGDIVMIAHSQGCLVLRLVLERLHTSQNHGPALAMAMRSRLKVYTFGNPAVEWKEHAYVKSTEHFANAADFVAKLGVLRGLGDGRRIEKQSDSRYWCKDCVAGIKNHPKQAVFRNDKMKGHLFGSQYSLDAAEYECVFGNGGGSSDLLMRA